MPIACSWHAHSMRKGRAPYSATPRSSRLSSRASKRAWKDGRLSPGSLTRASTGLSEARPARHTVPKMAPRRGQGEAARAHRGLADGRARGRGCLSKAAVAPWVRHRWLLGPVSLLRRCSGGHHTDKPGTSPSGPWGKGQCTGDFQPGAGLGRNQLAQVPSGGGAVHCRTYLRIMPVQGLSVDHASRMPGPTPCERRWASLLHWWHPLFQQCT